MQLQILLSRSIYKGSTSFTNKGLWLPFTIVSGLLKGITMSY